MGDALFREELTILNNWEESGKEIFLERPDGDPEAGSVVSRWSLRPASSSEFSDLFTVDYRRNRFPNGRFLPEISSLDPSGYPDSMSQVVDLWKSTSPTGSWSIIKQNVDDLCVFSNPTDTLDSYLKRKRLDMAYPGTGEDGLFRRGHTYLLACPVQVISGGRYMIKLRMKDNTLSPHAQVFYHPPVQLTAGGVGGYRATDATLQFIGDCEEDMPQPLTWYRSPSDVYTSDGVQASPVNFDAQGELQEDRLPGLLIVEVFDEGTPDDPMDPEVYRRFLIPVYVRDRAVAHERVSVEERHTLEGVDDGGSTAPTGDDRFKWDW